MSEKSKFFKTKKPNQSLEKKPNAHSYKVQSTLQSTVQADPADQIRMVDPRAGVHIVVSCSLLLLVKCITSIRSFLQVRVRALVCTGAQQAVGVFVSV